MTMQYKQMALKELKQKIYIYMYYFSEKWVLPTLNMLI